MSYVNGLRVTVQGDLPREVMERIADTVRRAVLEEVAGLDIGPSLHEVPLDPAEIPVEAANEGGIDRLGAPTWGIYLVESELEG